MLRLQLRKINSCLGIIPLVKLCSFIGFLILNVIKIVLGFVIKLNFYYLQSSPAKRVAKFSKYGFIQEVIPYLLQLLSKSNVEVTVEERKQLSDMALHGLVYQLKQDLEQSHVADTLRWVEIIL